MFEFVPLLLSLGLFIVIIVFAYKRAHNFPILSLALSALFFLPSTYLLLFREDTGDGGPGAALGELPVQPVSREIVRAEVGSVFFALPLSRATASVTLAQEIQAFASAACATARSHPRKRGPSSALRRPLLRVPVRYTCGFSRSSFECSLLSALM